MEGFAYSGQMVPGMGPNIGLKATSRITGNVLGENNFSGGDPGLQYRFWNQAENNYSSNDIEKKGDFKFEEEAFLDNIMDSLFKCRAQCKSDQGGYSSLRECIRACKGKGMTKSALKTKDLEIQQQMADALAKAAAPDPVSQPKSSNTALWIVLSIVLLIIIAVVIYFVMRKKQEVAPAA